MSGINFAGEGDQTWLSQQLDKVIATAQKLPPSSRSKSPKPSSGGESKVEDFTTSLASYLKEKNAGSNQVLRFLVTADWIRMRHHTTNLNTSAITKALKDHQQSRLGNPADSLNKNVSKGHCEKAADGSFFITPDGLDSLGHS